MGGDIVVEAERLSKRYRIGAVQQRRSIADAFRGAAGKLLGRRQAESVDQRTVWALNDASFTIARGEIVGIIGRNGAGKSTLLKLLSRITAPTAGHAHVVGRVGSLLEVGTGFHPELTGRENVLLNGSILGMSRREIRSKFDEIVAFAEIDRFVDTPVKRYSSGMYMRLAFAVAAHLDAEILVVDEVLAVGDVAFQKKCLGKMGDMTQAGRTVLFVSHSMASISSLCSRCLFLDGGRIDYDGRPDIAIQRYSEKALPATSGEARLARINADTPVYVSYLALHNAAGEVATKFEMGESATVYLEYVVDRPLSSVTVAMLLSRNGLPLIYSYDTDVDASLRERRDPGTYRVRIDLPCDHLKEGNYGINLKIGWNRVEVTDPRAALSFEIVNYRNDLMHKSYRSDRPGELAYDLRWRTTRISPGGDTGEEGLMASHLGAANGTDGD